MKLKERLELVALQHDIDKQREIIVRSKNGELNYIPIGKLFDVITGLYEEQQELIERKLMTVQGSVNSVMDLFYRLCIPIVNIRL